MNLPLYISAAARQVRSLWGSALCTLALLPGSVPGVSGAESSDQNESVSASGLSRETHFSVVESFLEMPPEQLALIRAVLTRIEHMNDEEKEAMRERIARYRQMKPARKRAMKEEFNRISIEERILLHNYWNSLPVDAARQQRHDYYALPREQRVERRREIIAKAREMGLPTIPSPPDSVPMPPPPERPPPPPDF